MNYKQLLILRLSNLTEWKNEREMIVSDPKKMLGVSFASDLVTCEFPDDHSGFVIHGYYKNKVKLYRGEYNKSGLKHGKSFGWREDGRPAWEEEYRDGHIVK